MDMYEENATTCQLWVRAPSKVPVVSLSKKLLLIA